MYYLPIEQVKQDINAAKEYLSKLEDPHSYIENLLRHNTPSDIVLVNAADRVFKIRDFNKIIDSGIATNEEMAYITFCLIRAYGIPARFVVGKFMPFNSYNVWTEFAIDNRYYILDPTRLDVVAAPNNAYFPFVAFDGDNILVFNENFTV